MRAAFLITVIVAAVIGAAWGGPPSSVIFPAQREPLTFSHRGHLALGAACIDCHPTATTSRSAVDSLMPTEAACRTCHAIDRETSDGCATCHVGFVAGEPPARVHVPTPNLKFDHSAHVARGQACAGCHGTLEDVDLAGRDALPKMKLCLACHDDATAPADCATCHLTDLGTLRTELPSGDLVPSGQIHGDAHDLAFARDHGEAASRDDAYCASCHQERDCLECHAGVRKPDDFHPGDYVLSHAIDGRRNEPDCSTCHRQQTFCVGCHQRSGIAGGDTGDLDQQQMGRRFHPDDWASEAAGGANRHAREARANLDSCASCHREDECLECHTSEPGSLQISPHGPGWRGSARCEALAARNPRMCTRCHIDESEMACDF